MVWGAPLAKVSSTFRSRLRLDLILICEKNRVNASTRKIRATRRLHPPRAELQPHALSRHSLWAVIFWTDEWGSGRILLSRQFVAVSLSNLFFWLVVLRQFSAGVLFLRVNDGVLLFSDSDNNI